MLIVDDSRIVQERLHTLLGAVPGIRIIGHAAEPEQALNLVRTARPDAIVLDVGLRGGSGLDVLRELKQMSVQPRVVVLTNYPNVEYRNRCLALGAAAFLDKSSEFDRVVDELLAERPDFQAKPPESQRAPKERGSDFPESRSREARYRALAEATSDAIMVLEDGIITEVNWPFVEKYGYTLDELIGRPAVELVGRGSRAEAATRIATGAEEPAELVLLDKHGDERIVLVTARVHHEGDRTVRLLALQDITVRRQLERQFQQAQKLEAVGRLAGAIAHDFNNVLTAISASLELVRGTLPDDHELVQDLDAAAAATWHGAELARQLLDFSRPRVEDGAECDLNRVLAEDEPLVRRMLTAATEYVVRPGADLPATAISCGQLRQIIMNLVINARDAMPQGGRLSVGTSLTTCDGSRAAAPGKRRYVTLTVSDTGVGMTQEIQSRIFEPFFTTKGRSGTGLGLASVYGLVTHAGGNITVQSEPGKGTTFVVSIPEALHPLAAAS